MDGKKSVLLIHDWESKGLSYRNLAAKYGASSSVVFRMIKKHKQKVEEPQAMAAQEPEDDLPNDIKALKKALTEERLKNQLLNTVIDIASKELGVDIRKKSGTRQSQ